MGQTCTTWKPAMPRGRVGRKVRDSEEQRQTQEEQGTVNPACSEELQTGNHRDGASHWRKREEEINIHQTVCKWIAVGLLINREEHCLASKILCKIKVNVCTSSKGKCNLGRKHKRLKGESKWPPSLGISIGSLLKNKKRMMYLTDCRRRARGLGSEGW